MCPAVVVGRVVGTRPCVCELRLLRKLVQAKAASKPTCRGIQDMKTLAARVFTLFLLVVIPAAPAESQVPSAPRLDSLVDGQFVRLTWRPGSGSPPVSTYVLEVGSAPGLADVLVLDLGATLSLETIAPVGTYFVRVRALNASGSSAPSLTKTVIVPTQCTGPPTSSFLTYTVNGPVVSFFGSVGGTTTRQTSTWFLGAGTTVGVSNLAVLTSPGTGGSFNFSVAAPPGGYWVRTMGTNPCGAGPTSNDVFVLVSMPEGSVTGRWRGYVELPCPGLCAGGFTGWILELDLLQFGGSVSGSYRLNALDVGAARESWGVTSGTVSSAGALTLSLVARGPAPMSPNPGGTFVGTINSDRTQINGTAFRVHVDGLPDHNPPFTLARRAAGQ